MSNYIRKLRQKTNTDCLLKTIEDIQLDVLKILDNITLLANSTRKTSEEKIKLIKQYVKEQHDIIDKDINIHSDEECKIIELSREKQPNR